MRFGLLYEHQLPRPWTEGTEHRLFKDALAQVELADGLGIDYIWEVEHHFLEEYAHSSAPEVFLAACAARTKRIRIGHGVVLAPPGYNHPARVAERIATLDLISDGRVDWGTGESASRVELEGFGIDPDQKKAMWAEAVEQTANMMAMSPYPGFKGKFFSMPVRNVVPKPLQKPHPPIWVACSRRETIHAAARAGIGALTFAFVDPAEAGKWAHEYYDIIKSDQCVPIGHTVNANVAMVTGFSCHEDRDEARRRGAEGFQFFGYSLGHYYVYGHHQPGVTDVWQRFEAAKDKLPAVGQGSGIGTPAELTEHLRQLPGCRRRPGRVHPAGRPQQARAHLRFAEPLRRQGDAGAEGRPGGARCEEAGRAGALHRGGAQAQEADGAGRVRRRCPRSRPTAAPSCRRTRPPRARRTTSPPTSP